MFTIRYPTTNAYLRLASPLLNGYGEEEELESAQNNRRSEKMMSKRATTSATIVTLRSRKSA
jgi:hypothetical protein